MLNNVFSKILLCGFLAWLIPFFASFFLNNEGANYFGFKVIMFFILGLITLITYLYLRVQTNANWIITSLMFVLISSMFDVVFIINILKKLDITSWVLTVLPVYLIIFPGLAYLLLRKNAEIKK